RPERARALDGAGRADLVAGALARRLDLDGESSDRLGDAVVHEADADRRLAARHRLDRTDAGARVLVDVAMKLPQVAKRLVLAEELHDRGDRRVRRTRRVRVRDLDLVLVIGLDQVLPARGRSELLLHQ